MMTNTRHFSLSWTDLSFEAQERITASVKESLMESYKTAGEEALKQKWHVAPKSWEEAYCRDASVDHTMWNDLDENSEEFQTYDWKYALDQYAESQAQLKAVSGMKYIELEVSL